MTPPQVHKVFIFIKRKSDMSVPAFRDRSKTRHAVVTEAITELDC